MSSTGEQILYSCVYSIVNINFLFRTNFHYQRTVNHVASVFLIFFVALYLYHGFTKFTELINISNRYFVMNLTETCLHVIL